MYRKQLIELLRQQPRSVRSIAELEQLPVREVIADIEHLAKSLRHTELRLQVEPARCRKCGFTFHARKYSKPSKCPRCRSNWIRDPTLQVVSASEK